MGYIPDIDRVMPVVWRYLSAWAEPGGVDIPTVPADVYIIGQARAIILYRSQVQIQNLCRNEHAPNAR